MASEPFWWRPMMIVSRSAIAVGRRMLEFTIGPSASADVPGASDG